MNDNDGRELVTSELPISFDELLDALRAGGAEVEVGVVTDDCRFLSRAND